MAKYDSFGTALYMGTAQVETAVIVGTGPSLLIETAGDAHFTLTKAGMTHSGDVTDVALAEHDTMTAVATKAAAALNAVPEYAATCKITASGPNVVVETIIAAADDGTFNLAYADDGSAGLEDDATSTNTTAGVNYALTAAVTNFGGPGLSLDTEDVTSHDSTGAWEEVVPTILRTGELSLELVFDPVADSQEFTGATGLGYALKNKVYKAFKMVFPDVAGTIWYFKGYVTSFEPSNDVAGASTATVTIKLEGVPVLA